MDILFDLLGLILIGTLLFLINYAWALWITEEQRGNPPKFKLWLSIIGFGFIFLAIGGFDLLAV